LKKVRKKKSGGFFKNAKNACHTFWQKTGICRQTFQKTGCEHNAVKPKKMKQKMTA
jgi:hypothetical protein